MVFRRREKPPTDPLAHIDPMAVPSKFRRVVGNAVDARRRFIDLLGSLDPGPVQDRLGDLSARIDAGVTNVWDTVQRAVRIEQAASALDPNRATDELKRAKRAAADGGGDPAVLEALTARFNATQRLLNSLDELDERLHVVDARLHAVVARAAELALVVGPDALGNEMDALGADLDGALVELTALRDGLDEVSTTALGR